MTQLLTTNGHYSSYRFDACRCGLNGFATEAKANSYKQHKERQGEAWEVLKCPIGEGWHATDPNRKSVEDFKSWAAWSYERMISGEATPPSDAKVKTGCVKVAFGNKALAESMIGHHGQERVYQCRECGKWHLTSRDEFDPKALIHEELLSLPAGDTPVAVTFTRTPNGDLLSMTLTRGTAVIRVNRSYLPALRAAIDMMIMSGDADGRAAE